MASPRSHGSLGAFRLYQPVLDYLADRGVDVPAFLADIGLPPGLRDDPDARVRRSEQEALWHRAIELTGDPLLPARVAREFPPDVIGLMVYIAKVSLDGVDAIKRLRNYVRLMQDDADLSLEFEPGLAVLHVRSRDDYQMILPACEFNAALHVFIGHTLSHGTRKPSELRIPHPAPAHAAEFEEFVGIPVRYGADDSAVAFPRDEFMEALPGADAGLSDLLESYGKEMLARIPPDDSFVERVRAVVEPRLPGGSPGIEDVAVELRMSARSVRRRLKEEGTTYRETLDALRSELAKRRLEDGERNMEALAHALGFSDASAFSKAFRRWTGTSPADFASAVSKPG